jgi:sialidase-1
MKHNAAISNLEIVTVSEGTPEHPRSSEGSLIELADGELFMVFQRWEASGKGSEDDGPNKLVSVRSRDGGRTWDGLRVEAVPEPGEVNVYCPNLVRLPDGAILFAYQRYVALGGGQRTLTTAVVRTSRDEGATFSAPRVMWERQPIGFASSACLRRLSDGRLLQPLALEGTGVWCDKGENAELGCAVSDDDGDTWRVCGGAIRLPMRGAMEGSVEELKDGRLLMVMRTQLGAVFKAYSADRGESWSKPQTTGLRAPESCPCLARIPGGGLLLIWNNSEYDPAFRSHYGKRSPLSAAVSNDEGETFRHIGDIENDPGWAYSNPAAVFLKDGRCILNYWAMKYSPKCTFHGHIHLRAASFCLKGTRP